jgi:predicted MFS family arabinose efflux permease
LHLKSAAIYDEKTIWFFHQESNLFSPSLSEKLPAFSDRTSLDFQRYNSPLKARCWRVAKSASSSASDARCAVFSASTAVTRRANSRCNLFLAKLLVIAIFVGLGIWWGLPLLVGALILGLLLFSAGQALKDGAKSHAAHKGKIKFPARFWIFATFALLYGVCETINGNWAVPYLTKQCGASAFLASLALTVFWSMVTAGRILFAAIEKWFPEKLVCRVLPFIIAAAFIATACVPKSSPFLGILAFALAGLGCSALLPLTISFGQKELTTIAASEAGGLIAFYQIGYGIAAFGVGPLQTWGGMGLNLIYGGTAVVALAMAAVSFVVTRKPSAPA